MQIRHCHRELLGLDRLFRVFLLENTVIVDLFSESNQTRVYIIRFLCVLPYRRLENTSTTGLKRRELMQVVVDNISNSSFVSSKSTRASRILLFAALMSMNNNRHCVVLNDTACRKLIMYNKLSDHYNRKMCLILVLLMAASVTAFAPSIHIATTGSQLSATTKTTMTDETTWTFRLLLNGIPTEKGRKIDQV